MFRIRRRCRRHRTKPSHKGSEDDERQAGPQHPAYPEFRLRRCQRRVCHLFYPNEPRFEEIIDVVAQRSVMASGKLTTTIWEDNTPDSLLDLSIRCILANPGVIFKIKSRAAGGAAANDDAARDSLDAAGRQTTMADMTGRRSCDVDFDSIHGGIVLPAEICERLVDTMIREGLDFDDRVAHAFADTDVARLRGIRLRGSTLTDRGLADLARHNLRELAVHNCTNLGRNFLEIVNSSSANLVDLSAGNASKLLPTHLADAGRRPTPASASADFLAECSDDSMDEEDRDDAGPYQARGYIVDAPSLRRLTLHDLHVSRGPQYFDLLLRPLPRLTHLDLSGARHRSGFEDFEWLVQCRRLVSLILHDVPEIDQSAVATISKLTTLRHLDISQNSPKRGTYEFANVTLRTLVEALPDLSSLDISGTNLAGTGSYDIEQMSPSIAPAAAAKTGDGRQQQQQQRCDIPGLASRVDRPLDFLGLYGTHHAASCRVYIPANEISGDTKEAHILTAGKRYLDRPAVLENVLNDLFAIFRYEMCTNLKDALDLILLAMERHPEEKKIQISGSASLYYAVKSEIRRSINVKVKQKILSTLLNGMFAHKNDTVMMRNGCLTLCQFQIPQDLKFDYERLIKILLFIVSEHTNEENNFVQRAGICLLNSLACQVDGQQKFLVGSLGAMEKMLDLIRERVKSEICDDIMETAWSTMWNVTDETPVNCKRFLDGGGMALFLQCKEKFHSSQDLLRNMMGLLGNVAEVPELRPQLMTSDFVLEFSRLLDSTSDGIEVSYNAAGVLAHMASDSAEAWTIDEPSRADVLNQMVAAIERWDINTKRNINYRSFEPILRLIRIAHTPQCQHWAVWALANLTRTDQKYCGLIEKEGGLALLEELINSNTSPVPYDRVLDLANIVRKNVTNWKERGHQVMAIDETLVLDG